MFVFFSISILKAWFIIIIPKKLFIIIRNLSFPLSQFVYAGQSVVFTATEADFTA